MNIRTTTEIQVRRDSKIAVEKTPCSLRITVEGQMLLLCDAVNGTDWIADQFREAFDFAKFLPADTVG
jgi:hypothetical protein